MAIDLTEWADRYEYAQSVERKGPMEPMAAHLTLLKASEWSWCGDEFGAASMDPKRPYGNSDVEDDLAELLPELTREDRLRAHCELPAVLAWLCRNVETLVRGD